ncbi:MAG: VOC family protein [Rhodococcus sp. (in: high G+C Gram-positive bacteria)]
MKTVNVVVNLPVTDIATARSFYTDYLGLRNEEFNLGWVARFTSPEKKVSVQLVTGDASAPEDSAMSVFTDDIESAYAEAQDLGYEIVHPLTTEPWGVVRFFVRAPDGTVVNVASHPD